MGLIQPIVFGNQSIQEPKEETIINANNMGVDFSFFTGENAKIEINNTDLNTSSTPKRGRPKKQTKTMPDGTEIVPADDSEELPKYQTNEPYKDAYNETDTMLKTAIVQIDIMNNDIKTELDQIRSSKTLKKKYEYISELSSTASTLLGTKISAIRELNKVITDCHNLELKRVKELKLGEVDQDDDKKILDMYNAFISTPISSGFNPLGPSSSDLTLVDPTNGIIRADAGADMGYGNYLNNLSPTQNRMRLENDPNVQTVVVFNQETGQRYFDVIDRTTGASIPNISKPDDFLLADTTINVSTMTARNTNLDVSYPLIIIGNNNDSITQY